MVNIKLCASAPWEVLSRDDLKGNKIKYWWWPKEYWDLYIELQSRELRLIKADPSWWAWGVVHLRLSQESVKKRLWTERLWNLDLPWFEAIATAPVAGEHGAVEQVLPVVRLVVQSNDLATSRPWLDHLKIQIQMMARRQRLSMAGLPSGWMSLASWLLDRSCWSVCSCNPQTETLCHDPPRSSWSLTLQRKTCGSTWCKYT